MPNKHSGEPANIGWLLVTVRNIRELVDNGGEESGFLIGCYLNDIIEVCGYPTYNNILELNNNFGMTEYKIRKHRKESL